MAPLDTAPAQAGWLDPWSAACAAAAAANDDHAAPGSVALAEICAELLDGFGQEAQQDLAAKGWGPAALGYLAGVTWVRREADGLVSLDPDGPLRAAIAPVFEPCGEGVVDLIAIDLEGEGWALVTGLGLCLGRIWPALDFDGVERPLRLHRTPRRWMEAGGWKGGPWQACCLLRMDHEARRALLAHEPPGIVCDDPEHGREVHAWLRRRAKSPALPQVLVTKRGG